MVDGGDVRESRDTARPGAHPQCGSDRTDTQLPDAQRLRQLRTRQQTRTPQLFSRQQGSGRLHCFLGILLRRSHWMGLERQWFYFFCNVSFVFIRQTSSCHGISFTVDWLAGTRDRDWCRSIWTERGASLEQNGRQGAFIYQRLWCHTMA